MSHVVLPRQGYAQQQRQMQWVWAFTLYLLSKVFQLLARVNMTLTPNCEAWSSTKSSPRNAVSLYRPAPPSPRHSRFCTEHSQNTPVAAFRNSVHGATLHCLGRAAILMHLDHWRCIGMITDWQSHRAGTLQVMHAISSGISRRGL